VGRLVLRRAQKHTTHTLPLSLTHTLLWADSCFDARGIVGSVYSTNMFNLSTGQVIQDVAADGFKDMYITVCSGACTADSSTGGITNRRGAPAQILASTAKHYGLLGVNVTLEIQIAGVSHGDGYIINNAHKVKLAKTTSSSSIKASADADFYTYTHGMHIMFRGSSRCAGRAARILAYDTTNMCATLGSNDEVGDYLLSSAVAAADQHPSNGMCKGSNPNNCDGPSVGGIRGAGAGHISSVKILAGTTAGCAVGMTIEAVGGGGSGFKAKVAAVAGGAITQIQILSSGSAYSSAPTLKVSHSNCVCNGAAWNGDGTAANGGACVQAFLGKWSDGLDACVAGGGGQDYVIVKETNVQVAAASGALRGTNYIEGGAYTVGPATGGSQVRIKGAYLFPNDMTAGNAASVTNVQRMTGQDVTLNLEHLQVLVGGKEAKGCTLYTYPRGVDPAKETRADTASSDISGLTELPEIRCAAPAGVGSGDLSVIWHGIPVTVSGWWKFDAPMVTEVEPASVPYTGGALITVSGQNFGPKSSWPTGNSAGLGVKAGRVEILGWGVSPCTLVTYVSDSELVCRVPPLSMRTHPVDKEAGKVRVQVVVSTGAQRSIQGQASQLEYTSVPAYYACQTTPRDACFKCCRSSCIVESFAEGQASGFYKSCDAQCYQFCGFGAVA